MVIQKFPIPILFVTSRILNTGVFQSDGSLKKGLMTTFLVVFVRQISLIRFEFAGDYFSRKQLASVWSPSYSDREQMETDITDIQQINR